MARQYILQHAPAAAGVHINYAAELNEQQLAAVTAPPGPLLVIAGAGSGKTRTLTYRVAYLLENGVDPRNILLLTFTNKAARQMTDRVVNLLPVDASGGIDPKEIRFPKGDVLAEIFSFVVNTEHSMEEMLAEKFPYFLPLIEQIRDVHDRYERKKKATNSMDFD